MTCFPDVNVWLALIFEAHTHHDFARSWIDESEWDTFAFCRVTQMGFLRLLTNPAVMKSHVMTVEAAWSAFDELIHDDGFIFLSEPPGIEDSWKWLAGVQKMGHNHWTDSYLAAFAQRTGYTLVTFDRGFRKFSGLPLKIIGVPVH